MDIELVRLRVEQLGHRLLNVNPYVLWLALVLLVLIKTGFRSSSVGVEVNFIGPLSEMPDATSMFQSGFGPFWLAFLLGIETTREWILMTSVVLLVALIVVVPLIKRRFPERVQLAVIMIAALPVLSTQFSWLGMYDPFIFLGLLIWGLGRSRVAWVLGGLIAASANPEQVALAATLALAATFTLRISKYRKQALFLVGTSMFCLTISQVWFLISGNSSSRAGQLSELLEPSLYSFSKFWPLYIWGIFGCLWVIVLLVLGSLSSTKLMIISGLMLVVVPLLAASVTLDGYRVLALVALPVTLLIAGYFIDSNRKIHSFAPYLAVSLIALLLITPPVELSWPAIGPLVYDFLAGSL